MPEIRLQEVTKLQQLASNPNNSSWVFASAGSGKTRILVNRLLRLLLDDVEPSKILCLTYTKAGASEMMERVEKDLERWVTLENDKLKQEIWQITGIEPNSKIIKKARSIILRMYENDQRIAIQTIHSFCQTLLKIFPFEAKINPTFEILEENSKKILIQNAFKITIQESLKDENLKTILQYLYQENSEQDIVEIINQFIAKKEDLEILLDQFSDYDRLIEKIYDIFLLKPRISEKDIVADFKNNPSNQNIKELIEVLNNSKLKKEQELLIKIKQFWQYDQIDFNEYYNAFFNKNNEIRSLNKKLAENNIISKIYYDHCLLINNYLDKIKSLRICDDTVLIIKIVLIVLNKYNNLKNSKGFLDYEDLILATSRLLENPDAKYWIQMKLDSSYQHILIDESQDTNDKQWQIIKLLSDDFFSGIGANTQNRSIFVVGDEKQSIYGFQGAQSDISEKIFNYYKAQSNDIKKIDLNISFRSCQKILYAVDSIFSQEQYGKAIVSNFEDYKKHQAIKDHSGIVEIWPLINGKNDDEEDEEVDDINWKLPFIKNDILNSKEILCELIAKKIKSEVANKKIIASKNREVSYQDYMILLRNKTNNLDQYLIKYLTKYNIPYSSQSKTNFKNSLILQDIISIAKFTVCDFDNLNIAGLLKSPLFNLSDKDLIKIIHYNSNNNIFENIKIINEYGEIYKKLVLLKNYSQTLSCYDFFYKILNDKNNQNCFIESYGWQAIEIIDKFLIILSNYVKNFLDDIQKFLEFIEQSNPEINLKNEANDSVKISTVHSAKGLQAPIVIIADCCFDNSKINSGKEKIIWLNYDYYKMPIWCQSRKFASQLINDKYQKNIDKLKDEYLRLLYVAMTRAEDELYISGLEIKNSNNSWYNIIKENLSDEYLNHNIFTEINSNFDKISKKDQYQANINHPNQLSSNTQIIDNKLPMNNHCNQDELVNQINYGNITGNITHKVLDFVNKNTKLAKSKLINNARLIIDRDHLIDQELKNKIKNNVESYINSDFFEEIIKNYQIYSEIELNSSQSILRIDLLLIKNNEVRIIDFKTGNKPQETPIEYINQLQKYQNTISKIYIKHKITKEILWLDNMELITL